MISLIFGKVVDLILPDKWLWIIVAGLLVTTSASAYMLKQSYIANGEQTAITEGWITSSKFWNTEYIELDEKLLKRERERNNAWVALADLKQELKDLKDEDGCLDRNTADDFRMLFQESDSVTE